jgi:hypothetical protein
MDEMKININDIETMNKIMEVIKEILLDHSPEENIQMCVSMLGVALKGLHFYCPPEEVDYIVSESNKWAKEARLQNKTTGEITTSAEKMISNREITALFSDLLGNKEDKDE